MTFADRLNAHLREAGFDDRRLAMTNRGAMKIVDEMEALGYIERRADTADGRVKRLRLVARGRRGLAVARAFHRNFERRLGPQKARALRAMLGEVAGWDGKFPAPVLRPM